MTYPVLSYSHSVRKRYTQSPVQNLVPNYKGKYSWWTRAYTDFARQVHPFMNIARGYYTRLASNLPCRSRSVDERLQDTLQIRHNVGWQRSCHVQRTSKGDPRFQGRQGEYELKGVGPPKYYLGGDLQQRKVVNYTCYETHAKTYITRITDKIEKLMEWTLRSYMLLEDPNYSPELDETPLLGPEQHSQYRMIIGSLNWLVTLGRYDIYHAASTMARYGMAPREGHLNATKRILGYLRAYPKISIRYNARLPDFSKYKTTTYNWFQSYPEAQETLPHNIPKPRGQLVKLWGYFDASHASCLKMRRLVMASFCSSTAVRYIGTAKGRTQWRLQHMDRNSSLGRIAVESIIDFTYRLRMLGVPLDGSSVLSRDNQSMIMNTTVPGSALKKRHSAVAYHRIREAVASGIVNIIHCRSETNLSNILTKPLGPQTFQRLVMHKKFPPRLMNEGELNGTTVNDQSVTKTKHRRLEITWPPSDRDLYRRIGGSKLREQCCQNGERDPMSNDDHGASNYVGKETGKRNNSTENAGEGMRWQSQPKHKQNK